MHELDAATLLTTLQAAQAALPETPEAYTLWHGLDKAVDALHDYLREQDED